MTDDMKKIITELETLRAKQPHYKVTRLFIGGLLKGVQHTEVTTVKFDVGFVCKKPCVGGSPYKIMSVERVF